MKIIFAIITLIFLFFFARNLFSLIFSMENYSIHRKRLKQLQFNQQREDLEMAELVDTVTKPVITHVFSRYKPKNLEELEADLRMARWDKYFTPIQYRALSLLLKVVGVVVFLLLLQNSALFALIWGGILFFGIDILFRNSLKNRKEKLLNDFPDFIRITQGYLTANIPFSQAVSESIKYVGDEWKPILQNFVVNSEINSVDEALEELKKEVDLFEMREFVSLVRLNLEQGGDVKDSFNAHAEKIRELQMDMVAVKIGKRQTMGIFLQFPLLLCNLLVFGLPTIGSMLDMSTM